jgi:hypothetical protein
MKHSIKKLVAGTALALGALGAFAADPIKIGSVLSVTGPAAFLGDPELKTLQLYVDDLNKKGGVLGRPLQLVHYDDGSDANKANGFTKRLIEDDKVDVLVGGTTTGATMSSVPLAEKAGIPVHLAGRCRGHRRAGQEVGVQDPAHRPHGGRKGVRGHEEARPDQGGPALAETSGFGRFRQEGNRRVSPPSTASRWSPTKPTGRRIPT